jgi:iron complex outermembrane recepter protein
MFSRQGGVLTMTNGRGAHMRTKLLLGTSILAVLCTPALAQTSVTPAQSNGSTQVAAADTVETVTVTARKRAEKAFDIPDAVTAFSAEKIRALGLTDYEDFTSLIPSAAVAESGFGINRSVFIRGVGTPVLLEDPGVGYYVDDVYMGGIVVNPAQYYDLERVEVLRGPQGGLYGQDAVGGAMNFISARPTDQFSVSLEATYANYDREELQTTVNVPITDGLAVRATGWWTNQSQGEYYNSYLHQYIDANSSAGGRFVGVDQLTDKLQLTLIVESTENQTPENYYYIPSIGETPKTIQRDTSSLMTLDTNRISPQLKYETDIGTFELITAYKTYDNHGHGDQDFTAVAPAQVIYRHDDFTGYFSEFRWLSRDDQPIRWVLGANYLTDSGFTDIDVAVYPTAVPSGSLGDFVRNNHQDDKTWDVFGEGYYDFAKDFELAVSARYSVDSKTFNYNANATGVNAFLCGYGLCYADIASQTNSNFSPGGSLSWKPSDDLRVYAKVQTGFRSGGYNYVASLPTDLSYNPETSVNYEIGAKKMFWNDRIETDISLYHLHQSNVIVTESDLSGNNFDFSKNAGTANTNGVEFEAKGQITDELSLDASLSFMDATITKGVENAAFGPAGETVLNGNQLPWAPKRTIGITADYRHPILDGRATFVADASLSDRYHTWFNVEHTGPMAPNYDLINLRAGLEYENYSFTLWAKNITNNRYLVSYAYAGPGIGYEDAEGTTYGITLRAKF